MFDSSKANIQKTYSIVAIFITLLTLVIYFLGILIFEEASIIFAIIALVISVITAWGAYYNSDKIVLSLNGARKATMEENQRMVENLEGLCIAAGLPVPELYIMDDGSPNAFATGRNPEHAVICVTTGLLEKLDTYELEGVLAHELSHIKNYDILLQTIAAVFVGFVTIISDTFFRISIRNSARSSRRNNDSGSSSQIVLILIGIIFLALSPLFANLLKLALSRNREYLADSTAIELTRNPQGLANALRKISSDTDPLEQANKATECMYISNPIKNKKGKLSNLFSTHPPIAERIERIENFS